MDSAKLADSSPRGDLVEKRSLWSSVLPKQETSPCVQDINTALFSDRERPEVPLLSACGKSVCQRATCVRKEGGLPMLTLLCEISRMSLGTNSALQTRRKWDPG